jgi:hypothetical protein
LDISTKVKVKTGELLSIRKTTKRVLLSFNYSKNSILLTKATALPLSPDEVVSIARATPVTRGISSF